MPAEKKATLRENEPPDLDTDIEAAVAEMERRERTGRAPEFSLPQNRFLFHRVKADDKARRRGIKSHIRPENAGGILAHLPVGPDDRTHCVLRGDFVLCDLIPHVLAAHGECPHLRIATLGMSVANADTLACLVERGSVRELTIVVSHYFQQVDKTTTFRMVAARLAGKAKLAVTRSHAKVILLPTAQGDAYVFEGSANLRSSDNLEQMLVVNDRETHDFHAAWIDQLTAR